MITLCNVCRQHIPPGETGFHCLDCADFVMCSGCFARDGEAHSRPEGHLLVREAVSTSVRYWRHLAWSRTIGSVYFHALRWFARRPLFGVQVRRPHLPSAYEASLHISEEQDEEERGVQSFFVAAPPSFVGPDAPGEASDEADDSAEEGICWLTYQGALSVARSLGAALRERLGVGARVGICAANSPQWLCVDMGCALYGLPVVPFHEAFTDEQIIALMQEAELQALVIDEAALPRFQVLQRDCPLLRYLVIIDAASGIEHLVLRGGAGASGGDLFAGGEEGGVLSLSSLVEAGLAQPALIEPAPQADLHTISYTSGSTGQPKGVIFSGTAWRERFCRKISMSPEVAVSYQPLSFAAARCNVYISLVNGGRVGFHGAGEVGEPGGVGEVHDIFATYQRFRPSVVVSVPRLWNRLHTDYQAALALAKLQTQLAAGDAPLSPAAEAAAEARCEAQVMDGFRGILGGRTQLLLSGGAPIAPEVLAFLADCFQCRVADGYGITECGGVTSEGRLKDGVSFRLEDLPALGYTKADTPYPRGELWVKTEGMADGYLGGEGDSARFVEGWFRTGDVVEQRGPREVHIIDRCAHVTKLAQGVFVSPERLEQAYQTSPYVSQLYLHCDALRSDVLALVVPNVPALVAALCEKGEEPSPAEEDAIDWLQTREDKVLSLVRRSLAEVAEERGAKSFERPRGIGLVWEPWSLANGCLTSTGKLARQAIAQHEEALIASLAAAEDARGATSLRAQILAVLQAQVPGLHDGAEGALGIDSLAAVTIRQQLLDKCHIDLPLEKLLQDPAFEQLLAMAVGTHEPGTSHQDDSPVTIDLMLQDAALADIADIADVEVSTTPKSTKSIFLTGATGFLGPHLVLALLRAHPEQRLVCLVREVGGVSGLQRLQDACTKAGVWDAIVPMQSRLQLHHGDLAAPQLALGVEAQASLAEETSLIVHNGAQVNHALSYEALRKANVEGTRWLLGLAARSGARFVFVSTTSAVSAQMWRAHGAGEASAERLWEPTRAHFLALQHQGGYGQSKAVAEALVGAAYRMGVPGQILRPGYIGAHSETGAGNAGGTIARFWRACWMAGAVPEVDEEAGLNVIPVDVVAAQVAACTTAWEDAEKRLDECPVMHLYHPGALVTWKQLLAALDVVARAENQALVVLPYKRWWRQVGAEIEATLGGAGADDADGADGADDADDAERAPHPLLGLHHLWRDGLPDQSQRPWPTPEKLVRCLGPDGLPDLGDDAIERWVRWVLAEELGG